MARLKLGTLHTCRWCAFAADALRPMKRSYIIIVIGLLEVPLCTAVNKEHRDALFIGFDK